MTIFWTRERREKAITLRKLMPSRKWTNIEVEVNVYRCQEEGRVSRAVAQLLNNRRAIIRGGNSVFISEGDKPATTVDKKNWG